MKFNNNIKQTKNIGFHTNNNFHKINAIGLKKAYDTDKNVHVEDDTLFIAGTKTAHDWYDDVSKIPFWGDVKQSTRYKEADLVLKENPQIKNIVSHSLGGSVALELEKQTPNKYDTTTYGAPVYDPLGQSKGKRYRTYGDYVSIFDRGAKSTGFSFNPLKAHSYENYD